MTEVLFEKFFILLIVAGSGVVFIIIGIPLWKRKVKPNSLYGFRIQPALDHEDIWYEVNAATGKQGVYLGIFCVVLGIVAMFLPLDRPLLVKLLFGWMGILFLGIIWLVLTGLSIAKRMLEEKGEPLP